MSEVGVILTAVGTVITSVLGAGGTVYAVIRNTRRADSAADLEGSKERQALAIAEHDNALKAWKDFTKNAIADLRAQNAGQQKKIDTLEEQNAKCQVEAASLRADVRHLTAKVQSLEAVVRPAG